VTRNLCLQHVHDMAEKAARLVKTSELGHQLRECELGLGVHVVIASSEDVFADALGGAEGTLTLVEELQVTQAVSESVVGRCDVGMVLGAMDLLLDGQRSLEAGSSAGHIALGMEDVGQLVEGGGQRGMVFAAMDLLPDVQRPLEADAGAGQVTPGTERAGQFVEGGGDRGVYSLPWIFCSMFNDRSRWARAPATSPWARSTPARRWRETPMLG
jgi:hypothetical protein